MNATCWTGMVEICHDCSLRKTPTRGFCAEVTTAGWSSICTSRWRCSSSSSWDRPRCRFGSGFCSCTAKWRCVAALSVQRTSTKLSPDQDAQPSRCRHLFRLVQEFPQCLLLSQIGPGRRCLSHPPSTPSSKNGLLCRYSSVRETGHLLVSVVPEGRRCLCRWPSMSCHCKALEGSLVPKMQSSLQKHLRVSVGPRRVMGSDVPDARDRFIRLLAGP